jgi:diacylglycerol kinase family enzyme
MGGDGSLAQTIKELRTNQTINQHINKIQFALLPYGTGNDTGIVFGWGSRFFLAFN